MLSEEEGGEVRLGGPEWVWRAGWSRRGMVEVRSRVVLGERMAVPSRQYPGCGRVGLGEGARGVGAVVPETSGQTARCPSVQHRSGVRSPPGRQVPGAVGRVRSFEEFKEEALLSAEPWGVLCVCV